MANNNALHFSFNKTHFTSFKIGAILKDLCLIFWDSSDNYQFEKRLNHSESTNQA
jgi:hypothetical protein